MKCVCPHCGASCQTAGRRRADGVAASLVDDELLSQAVNSPRVGAGAWAGAARYWLSGSRRGENVVE